MKVKMFYLTVFLMGLILIECASGGSVKNVDFDKSMITVESVVFEKEGKMTVNDSEGDIIAYYERFQSGSSMIKGVKVYNTKNELQYVLVPNMGKKNLNVYIQGNENKFGKISLERKSKGWGMDFSDKITFFGKSFDSEMQVYYDNDGIKVNNIVFLEEKPVILQKGSFSYDGSEKNIIAVRKEYVENNEIEIATWALSLLILNETNLEASRNYNNLASDTSRSSDPHHTFESTNRSIINTSNPQF